MFEALQLWPIIFFLNFFFNQILDFEWEPGARGDRRKM
jgi:hypothetical protein